MRARFALIRAGGRLAVAAPDRVVAMMARRAAAKEFPGVDGQPGAAALAGRGGDRGGVPRWRGPARRR